MSFEAIELPLACHQGHTGKFSITLADGAGWDLVAELDDRIVTMQHCSDWHRVERLMARIEAELSDTPAGEAPNAVRTPQPESGRRRPLGCLAYVARKPALGRQKCSVSTGIGVVRSLLDLEVIAGSAEQDPAYVQTRGVLL
jgi:hypothetical protein